MSGCFRQGVLTLVNVYVDLLVFTHIAGTLYTGSGHYWCKYYIEKHAICHKDYRLRTFVGIQYVHGDLCKHLEIDSSTNRIPITRSAGFGLMYATLLRAPIHNVYKICKPLVVY